MIITNPEHAKILLEDPLDILPLLIKNRIFNTWPEKAYYLRDNVSQEIIKSSYLILSDFFKKINDDPKNDALADKYCNDMDVFWLALTDENAAKIELEAALKNKN